MLRVTMRKLAFWMILLFLCMCGCTVAEEIPTLVLPSMLQIIEEEAFCGNLSIGKVVVPDGTTEIRSRAFADSSLVAIELPDSLTRIADDAFEGCDQFQLVVQQGSYAYEWAVKNGYIKPSAPAEDFTYRVIDDATCVLTGYTGTETELVLPNHAPDGRAVTEIGQEAFYECSSLTSVTIPNSVTGIGDYAFYKCSSLTSVTIPNSVTSIGNSAFHACSSLTSVTIPNSVTSIGDDAFCSCTSLTSVTIPNSVTSIGNSAFHACSSLTSVTIPNSVTSIGDDAFCSCTSLTSVTIPNSVTSIGNSAFHACSSLTSVTIPNSVTSIGSEAFSYCSRLTSVYIWGKETTIASRSFSSCHPDLIVYGWPDSDTEAYCKEYNIPFQPI
ncbi:MAG: leucine-rich repeat protein [bacterium]|nr:leucine-rich repeat protein [bacterium]